MTEMLGGIFNLKVNGTLHTAKGGFTYSLGGIKHEAVVSSSGGVAGFKGTPLVPYIEGELFDRAGLDLKALLQTKDATITLELFNGKVISLYGAHNASDGEVSTDEGTIKVRFEGTQGEEIKG